jgi:peptide chain release factor 2
MKEDAAILQSKLKDLHVILKIEAREKQVAALEAQTLRPAFWEDNQKARGVLKAIDGEKRWIAAYRSAAKAVADMTDYLTMLDEDGDPEAAAEFDAALKRAQDEIGALETKKMLSGEDDGCHAIFEIHAGAGGTESQDWSQMLLRMYTRYFERRGFESEPIDLLPGEEAGIKTAVLEVKGPFAYGYLKSEIGVHRLVRISPFDANARRHTSFASVYVLPLVEASEKLVLSESDIRVDTYRASGAGGQHVNKTDSAVRMTHIPTGIVAQSQAERSQLKNRDSCRKLLTARVAQHTREEEEKKRDAKTAEKKKIEWGSQIRSYVLHPYNLVKDHRTETETSNTAAVLDGQIDEFVKAFLLKA